MATAADFLQTQLDSTAVLVTAARILVQSPTNWSNTGYAANAFPREMNDVVLMTGANVGQAVSANGWRHLGLTRGITPNRSRSTTEIQSDQIRPLFVVHDTWNTGFEATLLEMGPTALKEFWQGNPNDPTAVSTPPSGVAQTRIGYGSPTTLQYQRVAILWPSRDYRLYMFVYAACTVSLSQAANFNPTDASEWRITGTAYPDTRIATANDQTGLLYYTAANWLTG